METITTTAALVVESTVAKNSAGIIVEIPSAKDNPYLNISNAKQGTLYIIIFPIIAGLIVLYLLGALFTKLRANRQAKKAEPFDKDYEFQDYQNESIVQGDETTLNPFGDDYDAGNVSFINQHHRAKSSVDLISQYRRSMDFLSGGREVDNANRHRRTDSVGSVLQLNFNEQPQLRPEVELNSEATTNDSPVFYSVVNTPAVVNQKSDVSSMTNSKNNSDSSRSFYSIVEPPKAAGTVSPINQSKTHHFHSRNPSSQALDDFISTGELPVLSHNPNIVNQKSNNSPVMESHSMFETNDTIYNVPVMDSRIRQSQPAPRSPSPQRQRMYMQNISSRSPSKSPTRSSRSPTRESIESPTRSSIRSSFKNV